MGHRPVTRTEVLLQQINDSLVEIAGLLQPPPTPPTPEPEQLRQVDGLGEAPKPAKKATGKRPAKKAAGKAPAAKTTKPVQGD